MRGKSQRNKVIRRDSITSWTVTFVAATVTFALLIATNRQNISRKWVTAIVGTLGPFSLVVYACRRLAFRWSFWTALTICLAVHLVAIWIAFRYVLAAFQTVNIWLWLPVMLIEAFVLLVAIKRIRIIPLTKVVVSPYPPKRETKAMTIGVGFQCADGVVLAADRQITSPGAFKFSDRKILSSQHGDEWNFVLGYAGTPDAANVMFRRIKEAFRDKLKQSTGKFFQYERAREILEEVYFDNMTQDFQSLIGFQADHELPHLFKTQDTKVIDADVEYIGYGDSSALRYLADFLHPKEHTANEACVLAAYFVSVANRYIDGCSGGPDISILHANGRITEMNMGVLSKHEAHFMHYEEYIGKELHDLLLGRKTVP